MSLADSALESDQAAFKTAVLKLCPAEMRGMMGPMIEMAAMQIPADSLSSLVRDLQNAMGENGEPDMPKLIALGKTFGLTDEMIAGYAQSFEAAKPTLAEPPY